MTAPLTLGTAGHIDHGKTALVRALTGVDTDRLPEERARGISIALGYARLELPSGRALSVVDVPGHERFVRAMVAGATGIDMYLMVLAADDGVMPQTREHAAVLRALGVQSGVVAITKSDVADPEPAVAQAAELLPGVAAIPVSARSGAGLDELRRALDRAAAGCCSRAESAGGTRLHVDRVFTIRGAGTVVTGTLWSGELRRGQEVELLPSERRTRVRGLQVHEESVTSAPAGQRVAVNLTGLSVDQVHAGDVLAGTGTGLRPTYLIDAELRFGAQAGGEGVQPPARVQVHHGTRESPARVAWLGGRFWQLRLDRPLIPARGDRLVIRQIAPPDTLGGGTVLDPHPRKHGPSRELLIRLERLAAGEEPDGPAGGFGGVRLASGSREPTTREAAPPEPTPPEPRELPPTAVALEHRLLRAGYEPPLDAELDPSDLDALRRAGRAVRVSRSLHYHHDVLADVRARVVAVAQRDGGRITIARLRDELGTSRKFAQALLEHFDAQKLTIRRGDEHVLRAAGATPTTPRAGRM